MMFNYYAATVQNDYYHYITHTHTHTHTNLHNQKEKMIGTRCYDDDDDD